ncbi:hypothetical protein GCM10011506_22640 [Marivirga lumbricoides]|uniref:Calcineurin-like phosphoesterase domain-containing protein n=2 Tax=Marivirga lumbricoides TaxID=1046115 RepID=A0ABQ1M8N7_9BACT|nr:hypothetical protein GCM10011506_22640 [Marivirga lumbricoides]
MGDAGLPKTNPLEPSLALLQAKLQGSNAENTSVVFLGDNIYDAGLHPEEHPHRKVEEKRINAQLDILKKFNGRIIFLPGNHDWQRWGKQGNEFVQRQEKYVESYLNKGNTFLPDGGCPGPVEIELNEHLVWLILDTQWWLHGYGKPRGAKDGCTVATKEEYLKQLEDVLAKNQQKQIIVSAHHPLYSNGTHGGYFPLKDHIFPLTHLKPYLYIPLPVIGSLFPLYRKHIGHIQDIPHPEYQEMVKALSDRFNQYENVVYTAGHDHTLQYQKEKNIHHIISGSGTKEDYFKRDDTIIFGQSARGFAQLNYYEDGSLWLQFLVPASDNKEGKITYSGKLK